MPWVMPRQKRLRILEEWNSFCAAMPEKPSREQAAQMRRLFYAGALSVYGTILGSLTSGSAAEPADMQMLADLDDELRQFGEDAKAGRV